MIVKLSVGEYNHSLARGPVQYLAMNAKQLPWFFQATAVGALPCTCFQRCPIDSLLFVFVCLPTSQFIAMVTATVKVNLISHSNHVPINWAHYKYNASIYYTPKR